LTKTLIYVFLFHISVLLSHIKSLVFASISWKPLALAVGGQTPPPDKTL